MSDLHDSVSGQFQHLAPMVPLSEVTTIHAELKAGDLYRQVKNRVDLAILGRADDEVIRVFYDSPAGERLAISGMGYSDP